MKDKEMLQASLLDLVFLNRNKEYGAYALRRGYPARLWTALLITLAWMLSLFFIVPLLGKKNSPRMPGRYESVFISTVVFPDDTPPLLPPAQIAKPAVVPEAPANVDYTIFKIVPDEEVEKLIHTTGDLDGKMISNFDGEGFHPAAYNKPGNDQPGLVNNSDTESADPSKEIIFSRSDPEFPGGREALERFLYRHLQIPGELEAGDKKTVQVRFRISSEGLVSDIEIVKSGGERFDKEVIRVCKKMPKWKPAIQNGMHIPVTFLLPVTFIAYEQ